MFDLGTQTSGVARMTHITQKRQRPRPRRCAYIRRHPLEIVAASLTASRITLRGRWRPWASFARRRANQKNVGSLEPVSDAVVGGKPGVSLRCPASGHAPAGLMAGRGPFFVAVL